MNLRELELEADGEFPEGHRFSGRSLTEEAGAQLSGMSVYELPPGEAGWPYHFEVGNEEWLIVIDGELTLRTPDGERVLRAGDVACFPAGPKGAHAARNHSSATARFAMPSTQLRHGDATVYPDSGKFAIGGFGDWWHRGYLGEKAEYWEGEP
jgi:uncharacterized cupin superfamily protein